MKLDENNREIGIADLPRDCVMDCASPGDCSSAVEYWRDKLDFSVDRSLAEEYLLSTGGWESGELKEFSDDDVAERILWLACGNFREWIVYCEREEIDPYNAPEGFDPPSGSNFFYLGE